MSKGASTTFIAFKIICLAGDLSAADKRVAGTLIEHHNRKSGRCDPSTGRIALLLGIHERTVQRSINVLMAKGYIHLVRMGGLGNRNTYELQWDFFREKDAAWNHRFKNLRAELMASTSSVLRLARRLDTGQDATLTCLNNLTSRPVGRMSFQRR